KCRRAAKSAIPLASMILPSKSRTWMSARIDQHFDPATMQRDSVSMACERCTAFSKMRERITSCSVCLQLRLATLQGFVSKDREPSNFKSRRCNWAEFSSDGKYSVKLSLFERVCNLGGNLNMNSVDKGINIGLVRKLNRQGILSMINFIHHNDKLMHTL